MVDILIRRRQNNPILTGEAGVGKTAVVEGLARADRPGRRAPRAQERRAPHARPRAAPGRRRGQGGVREPAQAGDRRGQGVPDADHPVHRRGPHHDRRRRPGRPERRRQPAQAGPGPRRAAHDRRHHLGRVQEVLREGRRAGTAVPGRQGRGARRGPRHQDDARDHRDAGEAPRRPHPRRGRRERRQALAPLHPRPPAPGQVRQPAGHRLRPGGDRPECDPAGRRGLPARRSTTSRSSWASSTARSATGAQHAERMAEVQQAAGRGPGPAGRPGGAVGGGAKRVEEIRGLAGTIEARYLDEKQTSDRSARRSDRSRPPRSWPRCRPSSMPRPTPCARRRASRRSCRSASTRRRSPR